MKRLSLLVILLVLGVLTACAPVATPVAVEGGRLTDSLGREVVFEQLPERIVVVGKAGQLILHSAYFFEEADERIIAMEQRLQREISSIPLLDSSFDEKVQFERDVAAEGIAPVNPDAVVMKSYLADSLGAPIEALGLTTVYLDMETPEQFLKDLRTLGDLFGNPERAEQVVAFYQGRLDAVAEAAAQVPEADRPSVLVLQYSDRGGEIALNIPAAGWLQTSMVELAGGKPVWLEAAGGGWTVVNFEQIAAWDPDQIYLIYYSGDPSPIVEGLKIDPTWSALRAVQAGGLHAFPGDFLSWDQPDPRWILGQQWLASLILPPETYAFDVEAELKSFYQELYGLDAETIEAEIIPLLSGDIGS